MLHLVSGINSLHLFVNLILVPVSPFLTHLFFHPSLLPRLIYHCLSITPSFTPGLKPTFLTNPTPSRSFTSSSLTAFADFCLDRFLATQCLFLIFPYFFVSVPCTRLSWPSLQLLSTRKYIVSYRIILVRELLSTDVVFCRDCSTEFACSDKLQNVSMQNLTVQYK